jgi:16S rRNA (cytidine1402-2'-O)-methyltransferase
MSIVYLIPSTLGENNFEKIFPPHNKEIISRIRLFAVENIKTARRMIAALGLRDIIDESEFFILNNKTKIEDIQSFINENTSKNIGVISEAGCPGIADPGAELVRLAHNKNYQIIPLVGPSSILMALMASGLNGQNFAFTGYLPKLQSDRIKAIKQLEQKIVKENQTQIFIETPYRTQHLLQDLLKTLRPDISLCVAKNITLSNQKITTKTIAEWQKNIPSLQKQQVIFVVGR